MLKIHCQSILTCGACHYCYLPVLFSHSVGIFLDERFLLYCSLGTCIMKLTEDQILYIISISLLLLKKCNPFLPGKAEVLPAGSWRQESYVSFTHNVQDFRLLLNRKNKEKVCVLYQPENQFLSFTKHQWLKATQSYIAYIVIILSQVRIPNLLLTGLAESLGQYMALL